MQPAASSAHVAAATEAAEATYPSWGSARSKDECYENLAVIGEGTYGEVRARVRRRAAPRSSNTGALAAGAKERMVRGAGALAAGSALRAAR